MAYKHETTRRYESKIFPGVIFYLKKTTEGRRIDLRSKIADANRQVRGIIREQGELLKIDEAERDTGRFLELQDDFDGIMVGTINPTWIQWGVAKIEGLECEGKPLNVEDWQDWPSALFEEILEQVKSEIDLNGAERKNLESLTTSGEVAQPNLKLSTVTSAESADSGDLETVGSITRKM